MKAGSRAARWCMGGSLLLGLSVGLPAPSAVSQAAERPSTQAAAVPLAADLPPLGTAWRQDNPYRGDARIAAIGRTIYNEACSGCHGVDADATRHVGNDLRLLDLHCYTRIKSPDTRALCVRDNDAFFMLSVLEGKQRVGVVHMPAWRDVLSQEAVWAIRTFIESRRPAQR